MKKFPATTVGLIFSVASFISTWTFVVPILCMLPAGLTLELIFGKLYGHDSYANIGQGVLISLFVLFTITTCMYYLILRNQIKKTNRISMPAFIAYLIVELFIIHPLFFYLETSEDWSRASDGQFMLSAFNTFPYSSISFVFIGLFVDFIANRIKNRI